MKWFKAHLNLSSAIAYLVSTVVYIILEVDANINSLARLGINALTLIGLWIVSGWVIKQKGQNIWYILLTGAFSPIALPNKKLNQSFNPDLKLAEYAEKGGRFHKFARAVVKIPWYVWFIFGAIIEVLAFSSILRVDSPTLPLVGILLGMGCFIAAMFMPSKEEKD